MSNNKLLSVLVDYLIDKYQDTNITSTTTIHKKNGKKEQQVQDNDISSMFSDSFDDFVKGETLPSSETVPQNSQKSAIKQETKVTDTVFNKPSTQTGQKEKSKQNTSRNTSEDTKISTEDFPDSFGDFDFD